jgi:Fe-S cluster assembly protein SufD
MTETPKVVTRVRRSVKPDQKAFTFTPEMMPVVADNTYLSSYRQQAWQALNALPFPTVRDEAWRRTDLRSFHPDRFHLPEPGAYQQLPPVPTDLLQPLTDESHGGQVIELAGGTEVHLNQELAERGVVFTDLHTAQEKYPDLLEKVMGKVVKPEEGKFAALAGSFAQNGVLLYVPRGVQVEQPLHSLMWAPGKGLAHLSHVLVYLDEGSSATYVHEAASPADSDGELMHAGLVEIYVGPGANLRFVELQSWGENVWNFSHERVQVDRDGSLDWIFGAIGSRLTKNFSDVELIGRGSTGRMSGFYFTDHKQHLDHDTQQNHMAPDTTSDLLFKGALLGESRSVWQGMIYVAPGAQKTDGYQANRNLVLSENARADSIPGLEILADDVRCTHGATVGKIDEDQVFYLLSRGIPRTHAERLIVEGFFDPIMQRIPFEGVRLRFQEAIQNKMESFSG